MHFLMQMSLPELWNLLIERGILVSEYRKNELLNLAREADKQKLERKCNLADESARQLERRIINDTLYPHHQIFNGTFVLHKYLMLFHHRIVTFPKFDS